MAAEQSSPTLKEIFNAERLQHIATQMTAVYPAFDAKGFLKLARTGLAELSVMQRMARVSECLHAVLPLGYEASLEVLRALAPRLNSGFVSMRLPQYVATYGADRFRRIDGRAQVLHHVRLLGIRHPPFPAQGSRTLAGADARLVTGRQRACPAPGQ